MTNGNGNHVTRSRQSRLHVAIIMDGSGRWAAARGMPRAEGHRAGRAAVCRAVVAALAQGIHVLTLFTFSTDNWGRPQSEVAELMRTFEGFFRVDAPALAAQGDPRDGDRAGATACRLPCAMRSRRLRRQALRTERCTSAWPSIIPAGKRSSTPHADSDKQARFARKVSPACWRSRTQAGESAPDVDLLIRTGGEQRLSNCPLWEIAYAELYFTACLWPDFGPADLDAAMQEFYTRHRRFGRIPAAV